MKKTFSLLAVLMLIVMLLPVTAMAVKPENNTPTVTHTLKLTDPALHSLPYTVTYSFTVDDVAIVQPTGIVNQDLAVTGNPSIKAITYVPTDTMNTATRSYTKNLEIDWSGVEIKEPGVYRWTVTQGCIDEDPYENASNDYSTTYLFAYAINNGGTLTFDRAFLATDVNLSNKGSNIVEQYPAKQVNLSIKKTVTGTQASKDQYFKFNLSLTFPTTINATYPITGTYETEVPATAYMNATSNPSEIVINNSNSVNNVVLWLRDGQTATIAGLMYGTGYTIVETPNGYTVSEITQTDSTSEATLNASTYEATDSSMTANNTITFKNEKNLTVPTGITLNTAAPVMGILLAMSLLAVMYLGKRKEYQA